MELLYVWVEKYKNIEKQGFNFSPKYRFSFDDKTKTLSLDEDRSNKVIDDFFGDRISNITAIVGENGSGKSNLCEFLLTLFEKDIVTKDIERLVNEDVVESDNRDYVFVYDVQEPNGNANKNSKYHFSNNLKIISKCTQKSDELNKVNLIYYSLNFENKNNNIFNDRTTFRDISNYYSFNKAKSFEGYSFNDMKYIMQVFKFLDSSIIEDFVSPDYLCISIDKKKPAINFSKFLMEAGVSNKIIQKVIEEVETSLDRFKEDFRITQIKENIYSCISFVEKSIESIESISDCIVTELKSCDTVDNILDIKNLFQKEDLNVFFNSINNFQKKVDEDKIYIYIPVKIGEEEFSNVMHKLIKLLPNKTYPYETSIFDYHWGFFEKEEIKKGFLPSGYYNLLTFIGRYYEIVRELSPIGISNLPTLLLIDEGEIGFHPQLQRKYISILAKCFEKSQMHRAHCWLNNLKTQIVLTSHSPLILSDLPKENVIFLENKKGNRKVENRLSTIKQTFGANIHTLLSDGFFMDGLAGKFSSDKINSVIQYLNGETVDEKMTDEIAEKTINMIGEPIIKRYLTQQLSLKKQNITFDKVKELENRIAELEKNQGNDKN